MGYKIFALLLGMAVVLSACAQGSPAAETPPPDKGLTGKPTTSGTQTETPVIPGSSGSLPTQGQGAARSPLDSVEGESAMIRGEAFVDASEILLMESFPVQVSLHLTGNLPTPCHILRAKASEPDAEKRIDIELYSLSEEGVVCVQMLQAFDTSIPLGSYPSGTYTVYLNGEKVGEFTV